MSLTYFLYDNFLFYVRVVPALASLKSMAVLRPDSIAEPLLPVSAAALHVPTNGPRLLSSVESVAVMRAYEYEQNTFNRTHSFVLL